MALIIPDCLCRIWPVLQSSRASVATVIRHKIGMSEGGPLSSLKHEDPITLAKLWLSQS